MSNRAIDWALRQDIPATSKWVLTVLCNAANDKNGLTCRRSHSYLAKETSLNRTTVVHTIQALIRNGKIEKTATHSDGSIIYRVLVAEDNRGWLPKTTSCGGQPVAGDNRSGCPQQRLLVAEDNRDGCVAQHNNQITEKKPNKQNRKPAAAEDPRRAPFIEFVFKTRPNLVANGSDFRALKDLLKATRDKADFSVEKLEEYWQSFLNSKDPFHQKQGASLRFFCSQINSFVGNGNGTCSGNGNTDSRAVGAPTGFVGARPYKPRQ